MLLSRFYHPALRDDDEAQTNLIESPDTVTCVRLPERIPSKTISHRKELSLIFTLLAMLIAGGAACTSVLERGQREARPLQLRDVPAQRLAYRFEPDVALPPEFNAQETNEKIEAIQLDFSTRREGDALIKTVRSPDGQRALALYGTADEPSQAFHIDIYSAEGSFIRNLTPPDLSCVFPETVSWSPDGNFITFIGRKSSKPSPTPTPVVEVLQEAPETGTPLPLSSVAPAFGFVPLFNTEQIYICNRDGYDLKPLTAREGLIYFYAEWAPDNHALLAMACRESEWDARERSFRMPTGRPRLITPDGKERLLDDELTEALPVWSPDSSKAATAFDTDFKIYDAATDKPTQARIALRDTLIAASKAYEAKTSKSGENSTATDEIPATFNPIIRMEWVAPDKVYFETAYVRLIPNDPITSFQRWHLLILSPQAAILK